MGKNISESLARLEESLSGADSAREMVNGTIGSYKDVSNKVWGYADLLKDAPGIIRDLMAAVKESKEHLSDNTSKELQGTLDKFTGSINSFNSSSRLLLDGLKNEAGTLRRGSSLGLGSSTSRLNEPSKQIGNKFNQPADQVVSPFRVCTDESLTKLEVAVDEFDKDVDSFNKLLNSLLEKLNQGFVASHQGNTYLRYFCIVVLVVNIITLVGVSLGWQLFLQTAFVFAIVIWLNIDRIWHC